MAGPPVALFPDIEKLLVGYLTAAPALDCPVCTRWPLSLPPLIIRVNRIDGKSRTISLDRPVVDVDVAGFDERAVKLTARTVQNLLLWDLRGTLTPAGYVTTVAEFTGPHWLPDENQDLFHWSASYEISCHA